ncbi:Ku protein [Acidobacterium sp. S8]|uniref:non-homologous end joining protein Ku n=1 Tax=Acidobacterium sp. S8 TaxID=1641854 RepID=UPI00131D30EB|nr:Ku protein [Acidobacterium sp. S8]
MARPTWSGQIQISLVSIAVKIFPASNSARQVEFHQIDRESGKRIHHQNVADDEPVNAADIVKGYEYKKGKYIQIEPDELKKLRIPTATTMEIAQFAKAEELPPELFDRPYFVAPKDEAQAKAIAIMRKALEQTQSIGIGKIAFSGREHLVALAAPTDPKQKGLMLYTLRFENELRSPKDYVSSIKDVAVDAKQLSLARQLIASNTEKFKLSDYKDEYETAVRTLVNAKLKNKPLPQEEPKTPKGKVIDLMDALRQSLKEKGKPAKSARRTPQRRKAA